MKNLILLSLILVSSNAHSNCTVFVPEKEFNLAGYVINFDFTELLSEKNYEEVYSVNEANYQLLLEGIEEEGRFHKAKTILKLTDFNNNVIASTEQKVTCITQLCSLQDYAKSFRKSYRDLGKKLPHCH